MAAPRSVSRSSLAILCLACLVGVLPPGCAAPARSAGPADPSPPVATPPGTDGSPSSSDILALLPDGPEKRSFILDCTGCHQLDATIAFPGGEPRSVASWEASIRTMLAFAGPDSPFPVIARGRDPRSTAAWLVRHLRSLPPARALPESPAGVREYDYPYPQDLPHDLTVDPAGRVVVTGMFTHRMLVLDPTTAGWDEVSIPVPGANPRAVDLDGEGDWWVLLGAPRKIGRYRVDEGSWEIHDIGMYPHSIRVSGDRVWFNGHFTSDPPRAGYVEGSTGRVRTFDLPTRPPPETDPIPYGLRLAPDGTVWMTELRGNRLVSLDPAEGDAAAFLMPTPVSGPRRLDVGPDGAVWIPEYAANRLARFDPSSGTFREFELPVADALPYVVRVDQESGTVWIGTGAADAVLSFDPAREAFRVHPLPTRGALVRHIHVDPRRGHVWAAYGASPGIAPKIARIDLR